MQVGFNSDKHWWSLGRKFGVDYALAKTGFDKKPDSRAAREAAFRPVSDSTVLVTVYQIAGLARVPLKGCKGRKVERGRGGSLLEPRQQPGLHLETSNQPPSLP